MSFNPDNSYLFVLDSNYNSAHDQKIYQFDGFSPTVSGSFSVTDRKLRGISVIDGYLVTAINGINPGTLRLYDINNGTISGTITGTPRYPVSLAWNSSPEYLAIIDNTYDNEIKYFSGLSATLIQTFNLNDYIPAWANCVGFTSDNKLLLSDYDAKLYVHSGPIPGASYLTEIMVFSDIFPGHYGFNFTLDGNNNLLISVIPYYGDYNSPYRGVVYRMNGISKDIIDVIDLGLPSGTFNQFQDIYWYGNSDIAYDPITGYPDVDSTVPVVNGVYEDPVSGLSTHGAYIKAIVNAVKTLGYKGAEAANIINTAAKSEVNK